MKIKGFCKLTHPLNIEQSEYFLVMHTPFLIFSALVLAKDFPSLKLENLAFWCNNEFWI